jgi:hypothetical protein
VNAKTRGNDALVQFRMDGNITTRANAGLATANAACCQTEGVRAHNGGQA